MDIRKSERIYRYLDYIYTQFSLKSDQLTQPEIIQQRKKFQELSREVAALRPLTDRYAEYKKIHTQLQETEALSESGEDPELVVMAREEMARLHDQIEELTAEVESLIVSDALEENRNVFLEIRAGAGGDEASLFVADLMRMYTRLAERNRWKIELISSAYSGIGGLKEVILYIRGQEVYKSLRHESGVHRVQRVPITESSGRIHTSTVTVAVLPEVEDVEVAIDPKDIRIDTYAASGPGGQHVNKTESAIRITHYPTGIVVTCQDEKSQHKNRDKAMKVLQARLVDFEEDKQKKDIDSSRKNQVGSGERSEKIRTYNFPQSRVTDHRIHSHNFNIEFILDGDLEDMIHELDADRKKGMIDQKIDSALK